jgi:RNA polymerase sigma-70 factor (ECF subfamily)
VGRPEAREALTQLCEAYWYPLYAYVRRRVPSLHEAQDLTQAFFTHLLEQDAIAQAQPQRGRFRAFLLASLKNFLANQWQKQTALKRGGGARKLPLDFTSGESRYQIEPSHELTPERLFERRWITTLLDLVLARLREEQASAGKANHFDELKFALIGETADGDYERAAAALDLTPAAAKQAAYRLRKRYRELLRAEVARTVAHDGDVEEEIGRLFEVLS